MIKYAKVIDETTKLCEVGIGTNVEFYQSIGMTEMDIEQAYNGQWYVKGYAPVQPEPTEYEKAQERIAVLKAEIASVDYKQFKYLRGELTAEEWEEVKAYIQARTAEINELESEYVEQVKTLTKQIQDENPYVVADKAEPETAEQINESR